MNGLPSATFLHRLVPFREKLQHHLVDGWRFQSLSANKSEPGLGVNGIAYLSIMYTHVVPANLINYYLAMRKWGWQSIIIIMEVVGWLAGLLSSAREHMS